MSMNMNSPSALFALGLGGGGGGNGANANIGTGAAGVGPGDVASTRALGPPTGTAAASVSGNINATTGGMTPLPHAHPTSYTYRTPTPGSGPGHGPGHGHGHGSGASIPGYLHDNDTPSPPVAVLPDVSVAGTTTLRGAGGTTAADVAEERGRRLNEVMALLRSRIRGRGVSREAIVQLSKLEGLECMWQEDNLTIAGSSIDLEVEFETSSDYVKNVALSYALPATGDIVTREDGAEVLKRNIMLSDDEKRECKWKKLDDFHDNIQRLARLDELSEQVSCFQAIEGLYTSLKNIWTAEEARGQYKGHYDHVSTNAIGGPNMDQGKTVGLVVDYWAPRRRSLDRRREIENSQPENSTRRSADTKNISPPDIWSAEIDCEEGYPSLRVSSDWVAPDIFSSPTQPAATEQATSEPTISWLEPPTTTITPEQPQPQPTTTAGGPTAPIPPTLAPVPVDRRFVAQLTPPIHLPVRIASEIYSALQVPIPPDLRSSIYDHLIVPPAYDTSTPARKTTKGDVAVGPAMHDSERWIPRGKPLQKIIYTMGESEDTGEGKMMKKRHDYIFHAFEPTMGCTIRSLPFAHPRQLVEIFPVRCYPFLPLA